MRNAPVAQQILFKNLEQGLEPSTSLGNKNKEDSDGGTGQLPVMICGTL